jgi:hypothetical protein
VSGLVAVLSADPQAPARGRAGLDLLGHRPSFETLETAFDDGWVGVCGRPPVVSLAERPRGEGGAGAVGAGAALAGEISNAAALRRELSVSADASPAALALACYERWRAGLFSRLEGVFALVVHDPAVALTLAGTDPFGVQFLYLTRVGGDVVLATEAKAFLADPRFRPALDDEALSCFVALGHDFARGLLRGVEALPQGCHLEITDGAARTVEHWDARARIGVEDLSGGAYLERLRVTAEELAAEACAGPRTLLPLTGGLDTRTLLAARPADVHVDTFTFGPPDDPDCRCAARAAAAAGMPHTTVPFETDSLARHADETVWVTECHLPPSEITTSFQMQAFPRHDHFLSGICSGVGRRYSKAHTVVPDRRLLGPDTAAFDDWLMLRFSRVGMSEEEAAMVFGPRADELRQPGLRALADYLARSHGMCGVDRLDIYLVGGCARAWRSSGLGLTDLWLAPRAPYLSRRWVEAVLAGTPEERLDDRVRVRLIGLLDERLARVPWVSTRLSLPASAHVLGGLRGVAKARERVTWHRGRRGGGAAGGGGAPSERRTAATRRYLKLVHGAYHRLNRYGDRKDEWLRGPSRGFLESVLLDARTLDRGQLQPAGVRRLLAEHMAGHDHTLALSILLGLELWQRRFLDGDGAPPAGDRPAAVVPPP